MRISLFLGLLWIGITAMAAELPVVSPSSVGMSAERLKEVDRIVGELVDQKRLAGATVLIARKGEVCFSGVYGQMDVERTKPMQRDTIFRIYSMTKAITSAAIMQLHEQGKLNVQDPVAKFLPEFAEIQVYSADGSTSAKHVLTIAHLLTHTSGLAYGGGGPYGKMLKAANAFSRDNTLAQMAQIMSATPLKFEPGTDWEYGTSIDLLGRIVEVVGKQPFDVYLQKHLLDPLAMKDTAFYVPKEKVGRFAVNYTSHGKGVLKIKDDPTKSRYLKKPALLSGGGGMVGTIDDYMRFLLAIQNGGEYGGSRVLKAETIELMVQNHVPKAAGWVKFGNQLRDGVGYGYGFSVCVKPGTFDPARKVGDYGWGGAASTHYWVSPADDLIVVTMEQTMPFSFMLETALKPVISAAVID